MSAITYLSPVVDPVVKDPALSANVQKFIAAIVVGGFLVIMGRMLTRRLATAEGVEAAVVPEEKLTTFGFFDLFVQTFVGFHDSVVGKENRRFVPFSASVFLFLLASNFLGLIPGMPAATSTVWINVGIALVVFFYFNYLGIKESGLLHYVLHFFGPAASHPEGGLIKIFLWVLGIFLIFPLEVFSTCLRVVTLNLRLYWNITADHIVLGIFTDMLGYVAPAAVYILGTFVSFMQAFIFTTLSMVYILLAVQHEEEH